MWRDSDLLCIGELQLLWIDKNSEQTLASLRLYFLPENTPEGRMDHGEVGKFHETLKNTPFFYRLVSLYNARSSIRPSLTNIQNNN